MSSVASVIKGCWCGSDNRGAGDRRTCASTARLSLPSAKGTNPYVMVRPLPLAGG
jgi:hypothetical protein